MSCPEESAVLAFLQGTLPAPEEASLREHLDACSSCRAMVALLLKAEDGGLSQTAAAGPPATHRLDPGERVGRYLVLEPLGAGGMSVVYSAYDPSLDRRVALKFLKERLGDGPDASARLLREAQAMARLSHPNVVNVYDAGTYQGAVFLAMERIQGRTLTAWLREQKRGWREVLRAFTQAGEGLGAAHRAGVVHRDFKPDNVLVDEDGRVRVTDFGLARAAQSAEPDVPRPAGATVLETALTRTGALLGTPAYMAPEQLEGSAGTAAGDQFSFCVALYEGLYGARPFAGDTLESLRESLRRGVPAPPRSDARVPAWLRRALGVGLSVDPAARHPDLPSLLRALAPPRWRAGLAAGAVAAAVLALVAGGSAFFASAPQRACTGAARHLAGVWDTPARSRLEVGFTQAGGGLAAPPVVARLDRYAAGWVQMHEDACLATKVRGEQSPQALDLRMQCLSDRQRELAALVDVLSRPDAQILSKALAAAGALTPLERCADVRALAAPVPLPADPAQRARIDAVADQLARVKALRDSGKYAQGLALAVTAAKAAEEVAFAPSEAEALYQLANLQSLTGDERTAHDTYYRTIWAAERARDDRRRAGGWLGLLFAAATESRAADAEVYSEHVQAILARIGGNDEIEESRLNSMAALKYVEGHYDDALALHRQLLALVRRVHGEKSREAGNTLYSVGVDLRGAGRLDEALPPLNESIALLEALGTEHPDVAASYEGLGATYRDRHEYAKAVEAYRRCLAVAEKGLGTDHPLYGTYLFSLGDTLTLQGKYPEALEAQERALALMEKRLPPNHPELAFPLSGVAEVHLRAGQPDRAIPLLERALALRPPGADFPPDQRASLAFSLAQALWDARRDLPRARLLAAESREGFAKSPASKQELGEVAEWIATHRSPSH